MSVYFHTITDLDRFLGPTLAHEFYRAQSACIPYDFGAVFACDGDVVANVWILEPDLLDYPLDGGGAVCIEFCDVGVVREREAADE